jgi:hypothetical protein
MCIFAGDSQYNFKEIIDSGASLAIVIYDQNFQPILQTVDGMCIVVVQVEDRRLFEIENAIKGIVQRKLTGVETRLK